MSRSHAANAAAIVVGVDGSGNSLAAVSHAASEAAITGRPLRIVYAFNWSLIGAPLSSPPQGQIDGTPRHQAEHVIQDALARARVTAGGVTVTGEILSGDPAPVLLECSRDAAQVVIGDRGLGGFSGLLLGSVAVKVAAHASCPVVVVRGIHNADGAIVVGVDGSQANEPAIGYAFDFADRHGAPLMAVHTWTAPGWSRDLLDNLSLIYDPAKVQEDEERVVAEALAGWQAKYPNVTVERQVFEAGARRSLIDASKGSRIVVVGSRGHGGFAGLLLGSVSYALIHHAAAPVAVVPPTLTRR